MPSTSHLIPLVNHTESKPTAAMRTAIANAEVGDEHGDECPTVNRLHSREKHVAAKPTGY